jgi:hypothetical protein
MILWFPNRGFFLARKRLLHGMVICESSAQLFRNVPVKLRAEWQAAAGHSVRASRMGPRVVGCAYFVTLEAITAPLEATGPGPHPKRFIIGADSVCNRGAADRFEQCVV